MSPRTALGPTDYAPTREQVLENERQKAQERIVYTRQKLRELRPRLIEIVRENVAPPSRTCPSTTEVNYINGATQLHVKHPRAFIRLEATIQLKGPSSLVIKLSVDGKVEGTWTVEPSSSGINPLSIRFKKPDDSKNFDGRILSTGTNLGLNGLTDKSTQRALGLVEHIVTTVNMRYKEL